MKKKHFKKIIASALALILTVSAFNGFTLPKSLATEGSEVSAATKTYEEVLTSNDYETAIAGNGARSGSFYLMSGDMSPKVVTSAEGDETNIALAYSRNWYGLGFAVPGCDYATAITSNSAGNTAANSGYHNTIEVKAGVTYQVDFDYMISGIPTFADLEVGLAVVPVEYTQDNDNYFNTNSTSAKHYKDFMTKVPQRTTELVFPKNETVDTSWKHLTSFITVKENEALQEGKCVLVVYMSAGFDTSVTNFFYLDNMEVKSIAQYEETELFSSNYDDSTLLFTDDGSAGVGWANGNAYHGDSAAVDISVTDSEHGHAILYRQNRWGLGEILLGDDYKSATVSEDKLITAQAGKTYKINFDYKVSGQTGDTYLSIGVAAGQAQPGFGTVGANTFYTDGASIYKKVATFPKKQVQNGTWINKTVYFTIPADETFDKGNSLMLFATWGNQGNKDADEKFLGGLYFDNVTVSEISVVGQANFTDGETAVYDFSTAAKTGNGLRHGDYYTSSGDLSPYNDNGNVILKYGHNWYGLGVLPIGYDYSAIGDLTDNYLKVRNGIAYKIQYDYRVTGTPTNDMHIGIAVGNKYLGTDPHASAGNYTNYISDNKVVENFVNNQRYETGWQTKTIYYMVPNSCDISVNDALWLYVRGGGNGGTDLVRVDFDNVKVTELAGVNAQYHHDDTTTTIYYADGIVKDYTELNNAERTAVWHSNSGLTGEFDFTNYQRTGTFETVNLYADWIISYKVKYYLNQWDKGNPLSYDGIEVACELSDSLADINVLLEENYPNLSTEGFVFDGWYALEYDEKTRGYSYGDRVTTVEQAVNAGNKVYAKWIQTSDKTVNFDVNSVYSDAMRAKGIYEVEEVDGTYALRYNQATYTEGMKTLHIVDSSSNTNKDYVYYTGNNGYAALRLGASYRVDFRYKATDVSSEYPLRITLASGNICWYWEDIYKAKQTHVVTINQVTDGWVEASAYFTVDELSANALPNTTNETILNNVKSVGAFSNALGFVVYGVGTVYLDDISVTSLADENFSAVSGNNEVNFNIAETSTNGIVSFDDYGWFSYDKSNATVGFASEAYQPVINEFKVNGKAAYKNPDWKNGTFNGTDSGEVFDMEYPSGVSNVTAKLFDTTDKNAGTNFAVTAAESKGENGLRFVIRNYSDDENIAYYNGEPRDILEKGVIITRSLKENMDCSEMTLYSDNVTVLPYEGGAFNKTLKYTDFSVGINNVSELYATSDIYVRGYMKLRDDSSFYVVYTDNATKTNLNDVKKGVFEHTVSDDKGGINPLKLGWSFSDNMVISAAKPIVYGTGDGTVTVTVRNSADEVVSMTSGESVNGEWKVQLPTLAYGGPYELDVTMNQDKFTIKNVLAGVVYLAAGQSNMEWLLWKCGGTLNEAGERVFAEDGEYQPGMYQDNDNLRFFVQDLYYKNAKFGYEDGWISGTAENIADVSAIAFYVANNVNKEANIPVGVIACHMGSSVIETWMPEEDCEKFADVPKADNHYPIGNIPWNLNHYMYYNCFKPVTPYSVDAVIWYQGESDASVEESKVYDQELKTLIDRWRTDLKDDSIPFCIIQIANFSGNQSEGWKRIQEKQMAMPELYPNENLYAVACDETVYDDIHPTTKKALSERVANVLLGLLKE